MNFELQKHNHNIPNDELLSDLRRVADELGKSPTLEEYNQNGEFHSSTLTRRFGNWFRALERAGLAATRSPLNISVADLFENLEEVWRRLGHQPRYREVQKPISKYSAATYENRFGSWQGALQAFVDYINNEEEVLDELYTKEVKKKSSRGHRTKRDINWRLRYLVMRRDNFKCNFCGRSPATNPNIVLHVDHIVAWAKGGETEISNLQTLCSVCNIGKSDLDMRV